MPGWAELEIAWQVRAPLPAGSALVCQVQDDSEGDLLTTITTRRKGAR